MERKLSKPEQLDIPITLLTPATRMENTIYKSELTDLTDQPPDHHQRDYNDFIDLAAHELDAPLRKLSLLTGRLTEKFEVGQNSEVQNYLERINSCVHNMQSIVDSITVLSRINGERKAHTKCNLSDIVQKATESLAIPARNSNAVINIAQLPVLEGNAAQLLDLFKHLLDNAIKFRRDGVSPEITVRISELKPEEKQDLKLPVNKSYHKIEITDNGIGFNNEFAEKIFQPFVRLHGKSKFGGNGMGLAICRKIVENHNGVIYANSVEKKGTSFVFVLPQSL